MRKISSPNVTLRHLLLELLVKDLIAKEVLLVIKILDSKLR